jgi:arginine-tRNA-protein transferase
LPKQSATTVFIDPHFPKNPSFYSKLSQHGFRRSGEHIYRPQCHDCIACIPVRLPVQTFQPRRSQRRVWKRNQDLTVAATTSEFKLEHFQLYQRYLAVRHVDSDMGKPTPKSYLQFLTSSWSNTIFYEFRCHRQLVAIAVVDHLEQGLSAVYTFFEPTHSERSLGVYAILWEIEETKRLQQEWLYLGYWIKDCQKMNYKIEYQPLEYYFHGKWQSFAALKQRFQVK